MMKQFISKCVKWLQAMAGARKARLLPFIEIEAHEEVLFSRHLDREVHLSLFLPKGESLPQIWPIAFFNDGQDMEAVRMQETLNELVCAG
ncbi:MAG: hypothetical protein AAGK22_20930, partial [Acidobacteriota bacterium]